MKYLILSITIVAMLVNSALATTITSSGSLSGTVNGTAITGSLSASGDTSTGLVSGNITGMSETEVLPLFELNSLISWKCRGAAKASNDALNLYSLTGGNFSIATTVSFGSGEVLNLDANVTKTAPDTLQATVTANGTAPAFSLSDVIRIDDYKEVWKQDSNTTINMSALGRTFTVNGVPHTYNWNSVVTYNGSAHLPFDQVRRVRDVNVVYNSTSQTLGFTSYNFVDPSGGFPTVSEWGLIIMCAAVLTAGGVVIAKRRRVAA